MGGWVGLLGGVWVVIVCMRGYVRICAGVDVCAYVGIYARICAKFLARASYPSSVKPNNTGSTPPAFSFSNTSSALSEVIIVHLSSSNLGVRGAGSSRGCLSTSVLKTSSCLTLLHPLIRNVLRISNTRTL